MSPGPPGMSGVLPGLVATTASVVRKSAATEAAFKAAKAAPGHPTLENNSGDVRHETDFRSVYARLLDEWFGVDSVPILGGDFRAGAPAIF